MVREILFRIKGRSGKWFYGYPISEIKNNIVSFIGNDENGGSFYDLFADATSLSEFTGLTDKNGTKIFDGDIHCHYDNISEKKRYFIVRLGEFHDTVYDFDAYGWYFQEINGTNSESFEGNERDYANIIGNIYDNPELLGDKNDNDN